MDEEIELTKKNTEQPPTIDEEQASVTDKISPDYVIFNRKKGPELGEITEVLENGEIIVKSNNENITMNMEQVTAVPEQIALFVKKQKEDCSNYSLQKNIQALNRTTETDTDSQDDYIRNSNELRNLKIQLAPKRLPSIDQDDSRKKPSCFSRFPCFSCFSCDPEDDAKSKKFRRNVRRVVNLLNISPRKKAIILDRYVSLVESYAKTKKYFSYTYNAARIVTTLCGIVTPALVSIQPLFGNGDSTIYNPVYWATWGTSLTSGLVSSYIALFKLDRKFYSTTKAYLRLEGEGWAYFTLTGKYAIIQEPGDEPTHSNRFVIFCNEVEAIRKGEVSVDMSGSNTDDRSRTQKSKNTQN